MEEALLAPASEQAPAPAIEQPAPVTDPRDEIIDLDTPEAPTEAQDGTEAVQGDEQQEQDQPQPDADALPEPVMAEIEFNGKKFSIPEELKSGFMMNADYTRKTQEVAELRKAAETFKAEAEQHLNTSKEVLEARASLINLDGQLKQYNDLTPQQWQQLENDDPVGAMSHWRQYQQLQQARNNLASQIDQFQRQASENAEQETAARLRETRAYAEKNIKGWNEQVDQDIVKFANNELGFTTEALRGAITPQIYQTLHLAMLGHKFLQAAQAPQKPAIVPQTQPLKTVSAKGNPAVTKAPEDMSMDEYVAYRKAQTKR